MRSICLSFPSLPRCGKTEDPYPKELRIFEIGNRGRICLTRLILKYSLIKNPRTVHSF